MLLKTSLGLLLMSLLVAAGAQTDFLCRYYLGGQCKYSCQRSLGELTVPYPLLCFPGTHCCTAPITQPPTTPPTTTPTTTTTRVPAACGVGQAYPGFLGSGPVTARIIGGVPAGRCEFPWMVRLQRPESPCGGALIDSRHIVTAGHCVTQLFGGSIRLTVGEYNTSEFRPMAELNFTSAEYTLHVPPNFNTYTYENDIAIVKLRQPLNTGSLECVSPICLPRRNFRFPYGDTCTVAGWGQTSVYNGILSEVLRKVQIPIVPENICEDLFSSTYFKATNYCAGYLPGGKDSCGGDSGGPLMCMENGVYKLAGIVSSGMGCAVQGRPAIYTDVAQYMDWIDSVVTSP